MRRSTPLRCAGVCSLFESLLPGCRGRSAIRCEPGISGVIRCVPTTTPVYWEVAALMTNDDVMRWLERTADVLHENRTYLTDLDSAIGDADHGINMDRGFSAVRDRFPTMATMDISTRLRTVGSTLVSTVGGAGGPLYGTTDLRATGVPAAKQGHSSADVVAIVDAFLGGIVARGK